ncbi:MAG: type II CRISPR-associated endonuclease Cas1 [Rickettsiales bacterium]|nr:MAG: type II CRISPR-associated endonuclease Cas1 [Rickettsiales bacterium]
MSWRIINISKTCRLSINNRQLVYEPKDDDKLEVPLDEIAVIVLDTKEVLISGYCLSEFASQGVALITTDSTHIPNGIFLSQQQYYKNSDTAFLQKDMTEPLKKRLWQKIIQQKIKNSSVVLNDKTLLNFVEQCQSGDPTNIEGQVAARYFATFFENFKRHSETKINSALNYGYIIVRSCIARSLTALGFVPSFGLHHCNKLNAFNLADDLLEPFRSFVDMQIKIMYKEDNLDTNLSKSEKQQILSLLVKEVSFNDKNYTILDTTKLICDSLLQCLKDGDAKNFELPKFSKTINFGEKNENI